MKRYECIVCGWIYDEALGCPEEGIAPGTKWEDIPDDWTCPECGVFIFYGVSWPARSGNAPQSPRHHVPTSALILLRTTTRNGA